MSVRVRAGAGFVGQGSRWSRVSRLGFALEQGLSVRVRARAGFLGYGSCSSSVRQSGFALEQGWG